MSEPIFTHDEAMKIVEIFDKVLIDNEIKVPSPEDEDRDPDDELGLYGSVYDDILNKVEERIIDILKRYYATTNIFTGTFSGNA